MNTEPSLKPDPDVKIPAAVAAAAKRSEEMFHQYRDTAAEVTEEGNHEQNEPEGEKPQELRAESLKSETPKTEAPKAEAPKSEAQKPADEATWEQRYKAMHGRYMKQEQIIKQMTGELQSLQQVIATMKVAGATDAKPDAAAQDAQQSAQSLLTDEEINEYGEDLLRVVGKRARAEFEPLLRQRDEEIRQLKARLEGVGDVVQTNAKERMFAQMDKELPQWRDLNTNQDFLRWLGLPDPYSGGIRHDMLKAAYAQGNAHRVLAFFNGFLAEEAAVDPAREQADTKVVSVSRVPLSSLAAPGRAKAAASNPEPAEKPTFTRAEIAKFYLDVSSGKYRGREAEKQKIEGMIFEATKAGRVR